MLLLFCLIFNTAEASSLYKFYFRIKTKQGSVIGNVLIEAKDVEAAKFRLTKRYPNSIILNVRAK
jgi:hypothetical protein